MMRFGIVGTNFISEWFARTCHLTAGRATPAAVCSRDLDRARRFVDHVGANQAFDDLDAMIDAVDAVYVASPIAAHHEQAMAAIVAGKHVLVEKTMGASTDEVESLLDAARVHGVVAMEAVRNVHTPAHRILREALDSIGTVRHARIEKLQYSSRYDRFRSGEAINAFDPGLGNSALADIGVYCLQPALDLFGTPPRTTGASVWLDNGFEAGGSLTLDYGTAVVNLEYSKIAAGRGPSVIHGEDGILLFDDPAETSSITRIRRDGATETLFDVPSVEPADTMVHELVDFLDQVDAGASDPRWSRLSVESRRLIDEQLARER